MENLLGDPQLVMETLEYVEGAGRFNLMNRKWDQFDK